MNSVDIRESVKYIRERTDTAQFPKTAVILGSGLGNFIDTLEDRVVISMDKIPHYPRPTVVGHEGRIVIGKVQSIQTDKYDIFASFFQGRIHYYERGDVKEVLYPIYVMKELGIENILITNAAGGINKEFKPGDLMLIRDQINLTFRTPVPEYSRYPRQRMVPTDIYDKEKSECIEQVGLDLGIPLVNGIYGGVLGPSYETPAEINMLKLLGADAVGMSTVLEVLQANALGMNTSGISCITNFAAGIGTEKLTHDDVTVTAAKVNDTFAHLLNGILTHPNWS
jgi:purine-nucleoside phosphorylase